MHQKFSVVFFDDGGQESEFVAGGHVVALVVIKFWRINGSDFDDFLLWYRFQSVTT